KDSTAKKTMYEPLEIRVKVPFTVDIPEGSVLLKGARLITMNGDEVIESGDILVVNNRIRGVGPSGSLDVPAGTREMHMPGKPTRTFVRLGGCTKRTSGAMPPTWPTG